MHDLIQNAPVLWTLAQTPPPPSPSSTPGAEAVAPAPAASAAPPPAPGQSVMMGQPGVNGAPGTGPQGGTGPAPQSPFGGLGMMLPILVIVTMFIIMSSMTGRREKKKRDQLISSLKRHDKVLTIGGIIATVSDIRDDEIVLRIDEGTNAKMRVTRTAIQQVIQPSSDVVSPAGSTAASPSVEVKSGKGDRATV